MTDNNGMSAQKNFHQEESAQKTKILIMEIKGVSIYVCRITMNSNIKNSKKKNLITQKNSFFS
jgi:intracellular sulfur oxidation DsrE/DsrF family protein